VSIKPPGIIKSLSLMLKTDFQRLRNSYRLKPASSITSSMMIMIIATVFIVIEFYIAQHLFQHIMDQVHLEALRYVLLAKLLQMVYLVFTVLLVYSNIVISISSYFTSPELDLVHCRPISETSIFLYRYIETFLRSSWMFIAFGIPILYAYGSVLKPPSLFIKQIGLIIFPSLILPAAIGVIIGILLD